MNTTDVTAQNSSHSILQTMPTTPWQFLPLHLSHLTEHSTSSDRIILLTFRLFTVVLMISALTLHVKTLRIFRWESSVSGGVLVTYAIAIIGLAICAAADRCGAHSFQAYICITGVILLAVNAAAILHHWRHSGEMTHVVAELLIVLGITIRRQVLTKFGMSLAASIAFLLDLCLIPLVRRMK